MKAEMPQPLGKGWKFGENRERGWMTTSSKWKKKLDGVHLKKQKKHLQVKSCWHFSFLCLVIVSSSRSLCEHLRSGSTGIEKELM